MAGVYMTKRGKQRDTRGPLQRLLDRTQAANDQADRAIITPEMQGKGTYVESIHPSQGRRIVNNHDPVERWKAAEKLTQTQGVVIDMVRRLWRLTGLTQSLTANYAGSIGGGSIEVRALTEIEAREDLHRMQGYVPKAYWDVFENVCRHAMPAGVAGGEDDRNGAHRAYMVVCMVADVIAMKERV